MAVLSAMSLVMGRDALAASCAPPTGESSCFDADTLHAPLGPSDFIGLPRARAMAPRTWSLGLDLTALHHPVVLHAPSPDPAGRDIAVVGDAFDATIAVAGSPVRHLELGAALPLALYRSGTGLSGVTSQSGPDLPNAAVRDLRLGAGYDMFSAKLQGGRATVSGIVRLDLSVPTGEASAFAGERSVVGEPSLGVEMQGGRVFAAVEERARLREPVEFGGQRLGTQWVSSLGVGWDAVVPERLRLAVEAYLAPYLAQQARTLNDGTHVDPGLVSPAEWMFSVRTRVKELHLGIGFGTAIPLSSDKRAAPSGTVSTENYAAVTSPTFRFAFTLRYAFPSASNERPAH